MREQTSHDEPAVSTTLTPTTLTLRLKHAKSTTLLPILASTPFADIKAELLRALRMTHPSGTIPSSSASEPSAAAAGTGAATGAGIDIPMPTPPFPLNTAGAVATAAARPAEDGVRIPDAPEDVLLARPKDPLDPAAGWERLYTGAEELRRDGRDGGAGQSFATPKDAGLKDGAVLAFKFRSERVGGAGGLAGRDEDAMDEGLGMEEDGEGGADADADGEEWHVVLPSFEDSTGVVNEGDLGVLRNYTG